MKTADKTKPTKTETESAIPIMRPDGTICSTRGKDMATGVFYVPRFSYPSVPETPTAAEVAEACKMLREPFLDFPFSDPEVGLAAALAALLTPMVRFSFLGPTPLFVVSTRGAGAGKGLFVDVLAHILLGGPPARFERGDAASKKLSALFRHPLVIVRGFESESGTRLLEALVSADVFSSTFKSGIETSPIASVLYAVADGGNTEAPDLSRRSVYVTLGGPIDLNAAPGPSGFRKLDLMEWIEQHRLEIVVAGLTLMRGYILAGKPSVGVASWPLFDGWNRTVRSALVWGGFADPVSNSGHSVRQSTIQ